MNLHAFSPVTEARAQSISQSTTPPRSRHARRPNTGQGCTAYLSTDRMPMHSDALPPPQRCSVPRRRNRYPRMSAHEASRTSRVRAFLCRAGDGTHSGATGRPAALPCKRLHSSEPLVLTVVLIAAVPTVSGLHAAPALTTYSSPRRGSRRHLRTILHAARRVKRGSGRVRTVCIAGPGWRRLPDVQPASDSVACPLTFTHGAGRGGGKSRQAAGASSVASINVRDGHPIGKTGPWHRPTKVPVGQVHRANDSYPLVLLQLLQASSCASATSEVALTIGTLNL